MIFALIMIEQSARQIFSGPLPLISQIFLTNNSILCRFYKLRSA
jgi:hypothetical protein